MQKNISNIEIISFIYGLVKPFRSSLLVMTMVAIIWPIDISLRPYVLKMIIDKINLVGQGEIFSSIYLLVILYFIMFLTIYIIFRFYDYFVSIKMIPQLRKSIASSGFNLLLKQNYAYYQNNFAGNLANKVKDIIGAIPDLIGILFDRFLSHSLALIIAIIALWMVSPIFALGISCWAIGIIICSILMTKKLIHLSDSWSEFGSRFTGKLVDSLSNMLSVSLFARDRQESEIIEQASDLATKAEQKLQWQLFYMWLGYGFSFIVAQGVNLYFLVKYVDKGVITAGDFVVVLSINTAMGDCLWNVAKDFNRFAELWGKITQSIRLIKVIPEIKDREDAQTLKVTKGKIEFENVTFYYKGTDPLFDNKSVTILPGQKIGLVGYSGSGKSSFVNLILRLFDVSSGRILIDGHDIRTVTQTSLREAIGMIPQEPSLFHRSLLENIRYGNPKSTTEEVINAASRSHANEFIEQLPEGYEALVGERGVKLSGGQRQRIAIARAILKNAPILILDEATSQLDSVTEIYIQDALWELMQGKTALVIAHRLSTLLHMDRILVFENGKIVEDGSHDELIKKSGMYKTLWDAQVGGFLPEKENEEN